MSGSAGTLLYLLLVIVAYAAAGHNDMLEEQRLSLQGYVNDHATVAIPAPRRLCSDRD